MEKGIYQCRNYGKNCEYARKRTKILCEDGGKLTVDGKPFQCPVNNPTCQHELRRVGGSGSGAGKWRYIVAAISLVAVGLLAWAFLPRRPQPVTILLTLSAPGFGRELELLSPDAVTNMGIKLKDGEPTFYPNKDKAAKRLRIRHGLREAPSVLYTRINSGEWVAHQFEPAITNRPPPPVPVITNEDLRPRPGPVLVKRKVLIPIQAVDTNVTIELGTDQLIATVKVRVNSGVEQALANRDMEATTVTLQPVTTQELLSEVITQINDDPPQVHRFPGYGKRRITLWVEGVNAGVVAAERIAIALLARESKIKEDPVVANAFSFWTNKYCQDLRLLPILEDEESRTSAYDQLVDRYGKQNRSQLLTLMMPVLGRHIAELRTTGTIPTNFLHDILQAYRSHPNFLKEPKSQ